MTAKDYWIIAKAIKEQVDLLRHRVDEPTVGLAVAAIEGVAVRLSVALARDNPRFDRKRFMEACGFVG